MIHLTSNWQSLCFLIFSALRCCWLLKQSTAADASIRTRWSHGSFMCCTNCPHAIHQTHHLYKVWNKINIVQGPSFCFFFFLLIRKQEIYYNDYLSMLVGSHIVYLTNQSRPSVVFEYLQYFLYIMITKQLKLCIMFCKNTRGIEAITPHAVRAV